jgi:hypothetical protein
MGCKLLLFSRSVSRFERDEKLSGIDPVSPLKFSWICLSSFMFPILSGRVPER